MPCSIWSAHESEWRVDSDILTLKGTGKTGKRLCAIGFAAGERVANWPASSPRSDECHGAPHHSSGTAGRWRIETHSEGVALIDG